MTALSKDDGEPLTVDDLNEGCQLLMDYKKKSWAVTVVSVMGELNGMKFHIWACLIIILTILDSKKRKTSPTELDNSIIQAKRTVSMVTKQKMLQIVQIVQTYWQQHCFVITYQHKLHMCS